MRNDRMSRSAVSARRTSSCQCSACMYRFAVGSEPASGSRRKCRPGHRTADPPRRHRREPRARVPGGPPKRTSNTRQRLTRILPDQLPHDRTRLGVASLAHHRVRRNLLLRSEDLCALRSAERLASVDRALRLSWISISVAGRSAVTSTAWNSTAPGAALHR